MTINAVNIVKLMLIDVEKCSKVTEINSKQILIKNYLLGKYTMYF